MENLIKARQPVVHHSVADLYDKRPRAFSIYLESPIHDWNSDCMDFHQGASANARAHTSHPSENNRSPKHHHSSESRCARGSGILPSSDYNALPSYRFRHRGKRHSRGLEKITQHSNLAYRLIIIFLLSDLPRSDQSRSLYWYSCNIGSIIRCDPSIFADMVHIIRFQRIGFACDFGEIQLLLQAYRSDKSRYNCPN